jgi:hypothetical protein
MGSSYIQFCPVAKAMELSLVALVGTSERP